MIDNNFWGKDGPLLTVSERKLIAAFLLLYVIVIFTMAALVIAGVVK